MTVQKTDRCTATRRVAGSKIVHTVTDWYGETAINGVRRSERRYDYAIVRRRVAEDNGQATISVERWSNSARCSGKFFAVKVEEQS